MIQRALIIDTETNGLDDAAQVIEVGAILYSVENQCTLQEMSTLLPALKNDAESINRIKVSVLDEIVNTRSVSFAQEFLFAMSKSADVFVAHNAEFDSKKMLGDTRFLPLASLPWVCTQSDFKWPAGRSQDSLINTALANDVAVASAHRALTDCRLIAALFDRMTDLQSMFVVAMRPKALFVGLQPFDDNQLAKDAGFKWDRLVPRKWSRMMAIEDAANLSFPVRRVEQ